MNPLSATISDLAVECPRNSPLLYLRQAQADVDPVEILIHESQIPWLIAKLSAAIAPPKPAPRRAGSEIRNPKSHRRRP